MNKIDQLINEGAITLQDVLEYAESFRLYQEQMETEEWLKDDEPMYDTYGEDKDPRSLNPEYIIASTSFRATTEETYVFEANENGDITSLSEYGGLAKRYGDENWMDGDAAVKNVFGDAYEFVRRVATESVLIMHSLYKRK